MMPIEPVDASTIRKRVESYFAERGELMTHLAIYVAINFGLGVIWLWTGAAEGLWPWPLVVMLAWGAGLAGHGLDVLARSPRRLAQADRDAFDQMARLYGDDWQDTAPEAEYERIYAAAHEALDEKKDFTIHLVIYILVNLAAWALWFGAERPDFVFPLVLMFFWGIGLGIHGASTFASSTRGSARREEAIQQAVEREQEWLYGASSSGKAKRKRQPDTQRLMRTNDGEVLEVAEEDWKNDDQSSHLNTRS